MIERIEHDTMGAVRVPADRLWGAQTERSRTNFRIGAERMPLALIHAMVRVKRACAVVNHRQGRLSAEARDLIVQVCDEILTGRHDDEFPLSVWQTGSGTQTNMNVNEVIANRAAQIVHGRLDRARPVHPNDQVNLSQSSNDVFPTAMHVAAVYALEDQLLPALADLHRTLEEKAEAFADILGGAWTADMQRAWDDLTAKVEQIVRGQPQTICRQRQQCPGFADERGDFFQ